MLMGPITDTSIRWTPGERLNHLFEQRCDEILRTDGTSDIAIIAQNGACSFRELDDRSNQLARHLSRCGVKPGDHVAILFDRGVELYIALLAILKAGAAYVPLDRAFPKERISFILDDAQVGVIVSQQGFAGKLDTFRQKKVYIDADQTTIDRLPSERLIRTDAARPADELCYIIYTSGTTGNPKGVAINHSSICNFVRVAADTYGIRRGDLVYQGMTIAFDFSVEELWVPMLAGATLVPAPPDTNLVGEELARYLVEHRITVLCCVPTLLASIDHALPDVRLLLVSGEPCPQGLVHRWYRPDRLILNAYGPTEATVTATLAVLCPDKPATIGHPLPSYTIVILDPDKDRLAPFGQTGEIGIAGVGLARGYLNRDDLTKAKFITDFVGLPDNPSKRIYRTGDLGRLSPRGEIEYLGRIDTQVKVRGYRIELTEIESLMLQLPQVAQAVVSTYEAEPGIVELVAYFSRRPGAAELPAAELLAVLRKHVPAYMVPAYVEELPFIPISTCSKVDRKGLPPPKGPRCCNNARRHKPPRDGVERLIVEALREVLKIDEISVTDNFFDDLGAHSILMARFCSIARRRISGTDISMRDVYLNPTVEQLAGVLRDGRDRYEQATPSQPCHRPSLGQFYLCGCLQLLTYLSLSMISIGVLIGAVEYCYSAMNDKIELYRRSILVLASLYGAMSVVPILAKWHLIGKWRPGTIKIWSLDYFRFWLAKLLISSSPQSLFLGTPLYNAHLRLLGARIGRNAVVLSRAPVTTDLFSVGDDAIVRPDVMMPGYRARANLIEIGGVDIGSDAFVGSASVLDIDTAIGRGGALGHSSTLQAGQSVPSGKSYHGTPAEETNTNFQTVEPRPCSAFRRWTYALILLVLTIVLLPVPAILLLHAYQLLEYLTVSNQLSHGTPWSILINLIKPGVLIATIAFLALIALGLLVVQWVPRLLNLLLDEGRTYVLFGFHHFVQSLIRIMSNVAHFNLIFGDSSLIVHYLKMAGYRLGKIEQTGANFGLDQLQDNPYLCHVGTGTMISDGLVFANTDYSSSSFRLSPINIGGRNYLGNNLYVPGGNRTGDNVLLATKVMVPIDGAVRENIGLLGSPAFSIPRMVELDNNALSMLNANARRDGLARKNRWNAATIVLVILSYWFAWCLTLFTFYFAVLHYDDAGAAGIVAWFSGVVIFNIVYFTAILRASLGFRRLKCLTVSMYDRNFLVHERYWKFCGHPLNTLFPGTPFRPWLARLLGTRVGSLVFDDGANLFDRTLLELGDNINLNLGCVLQAHSLEDGVFKSDKVRIGNGCTIGVGAFVHYGTRFGDNAELGPNAFLMKGESVPANSVWQGNPARPLRQCPRAAKSAVEDVITIAGESEPIQSARRISGDCVPPQCAAQQLA